MGCRGSEPHSRCSCHCKLPSDVLIPRKPQQLYKILPVAEHLQHRWVILPLPWQWPEAESFFPGKHPCWLLPGPACLSSQVKVKVRARAAGRWGYQARSPQPVFAQRLFCASPTLGSQGTWVHFLSWEGHCQGEEMALPTRNESPWLSCRRRFTQSFNNSKLGTSLAVQGQRLCAPKAECPWFDACSGN